MKVSGFSEYSFSHIAVNVLCIQNKICKTVLIIHCISNNVEKNDFHLKKNKKNLSRISVVQFKIFFERERPCLLDFRYDERCPTVSFLLSDNTRK